MNKLIFLLTITALSLGSCKDRNKNKLFNPDAQANTFEDTATVRIIDSSYNFGTVKDGEKVVYSYRFVNTGKNLLVVNKAQPSCGCTIAESPKEPIRTGDTGYIKIVFDSKNKTGEVHKSIHVISNAFEGFPDLQLTGTVLADK